MPLTVPVAERSRLTWRDAAGEHTAVWVSPGAPPPARLGAAGDDTRAAAAAARARRGEGLVYSGDYHNARQLLTALARRLPAARPRGPGPAALFHAERERTRLEQALLSRLLVPLEPGWRVPLRRAPDVRERLRGGAGPAPGRVTALLPLRDLLGMIGAHEWRRRGVEVRALGAAGPPALRAFMPRSGASTSTWSRGALAAWPVAGKRAFDVGTGTGVLALLLARAGARVVATDLDPRAIACARENAARLDLAARVEVTEADLFPEGEADLVVSNPPWVPAEAHGRSTGPSTIPAARSSSGSCAGSRPTSRPAARRGSSSRTWPSGSGCARRTTSPRLAAPAGLAVAAVLRDPAHAPADARPRTIRSTRSGPPR